MLACFWSTTHYRKRSFITKIAIARLRVTKLAITIGQAIAAVAPDRRALPDLDAPATPERVLAAIAAHRGTPARAE